MQKIKVENMRSERSGRAVANQFIIITDNATIFQSYQTVIAVIQWTIEGKKTYLDRESWDYSVTTGKYRNQFLGESKRETERKIADGTYIFADLN